MKIFANSETTGNWKAALSALAGQSALVQYTAFPERRREKIRNADTIAVMEKGQITEMGSHDDLVSQEGLYARLWSVQTGEASE